MLVIKTKLVWNDKRFVTGWKFYTSPLFVKVAIKFFQIFVTYNLFYFLFSQITLRIFPINGEGRELHMLSFELLNPRVSSRVGELDTPKQTNQVGPGWSAIHNKCGFGTFLAQENLKRFAYVVVRIANPLGFVHHDHLTRQHHGKQHRVGAEEIRTYQNYIRLTPPGVPLADQLVGLGLSSI